MTSIVRTHSGSLSYRTMSLTFGVALLAFGTAPASAQEACRIQEIDPLDSEVVSVNAMNDWGQVVGELAYYDRTSRAFVWYRGVTSLLPPLENAVRSAARAINERGDIVGDIEVDRQRVPVVWMNGRVQRLPGGVTGTAVDINNRGQILAIVSPARCVLWPDARSLPVDLGTFGGDTCIPHGLNDLGQVVGIIRTGNFPSMGFIWRDGVFTPVPPPSTAPANSVVSLMKINNTGTAFGTLLVGYGEAIVWTREGGVRPLGVYGSSLNDWGTIAASDRASPISNLLLADRFGRVVNRGSLGRHVDEILINNFYQIAFSGHLEGDGGHLARFCQLR